MAWTWRCLNQQGGEVERSEQRETFPNQGDAESWLAENHRVLAADGVATVELLEDERMEYSMPLG